MDGFPGGVVGEFNFGLLFLTGVGKDFGFTLGVLVPVLSVGEGEGFVVFEDADVGLGKVVGRLL